MTELNSRNFGFLIAYLIPGFVILLGLAYVSPPIRSWLATSPGSGEWPTIGGFLYVTLASLVAGMSASAVRFVLLDKMFQWMGITRPNWDDATLRDRLSAYEFLVEIHYRYYQFHANMIVALVVAYAARRFGINGSDFPDWSDLLLIPFCVVFGFTAKDNLANYYRRVSNLTQTRKDTQDE